MTNTHAYQIVPFVERVSSDWASSDKHIFRIGYRTEDAGDILAAIDIPIHMLEQEVASGLELVTAATPSGDIMSVVLDSSGLALSRPRSVASIHQLVSQVVSTDSLRLEEITANDLRDLLRTLELATDLVRSALARVYSEVERQEL